MWDVLNRHPRGRLSQRKLHVLATGLIVAALLCLGTLTRTSYADTNSAVMKDGALQYNGDTYTQQPDLGANDPRNFSAGTHDYSFTPSGSNKVNYIFIDSATAVDQATIGAYVTYTYTPPNTYTDQSTPVQLTITHAAGDPTVKTSTTSCSSDGFGSLGWILCPVTTGISRAVDGIYNIITQFFDTPSLTSDSAVYKIWDTVRSIANIAFVIAFIIIIYSQITSMGISKYGIRTMLPRLIVASVLVNISYWICSLGIDLSNFLGHSVETFFASYLQTLQGTTVIPDWSSITQVLIAGGTGGVALIGGVSFLIINAGSLPAILYILLGIVVSVALAIIVALIILAARQAILIIFTIVSPLAFVAMILPSTEKLFGKWKDTMLSMLIMFPLFGLIYGGAQVAGAAIIIGSKGSLLLLLLGKFVTFIPLAITPLLIKFSSGILGTVASAIDGRRKAIKDRFGKWNDQQIDFHRKMSLGNTERRGNPFRRGAQYFDSRKRIQDQALQGAEARSTALAMNRKGRLLNYRKAFNSTQDANRTKETAENNLKSQYETLRRNDARTMQTNLQAKVAEAKAKLEAEETDTMYANIIAEGDKSAHLVGLDAQLKGKTSRGTAKLQKEFTADINSAAQALKGTTEQIVYNSIAKKMADRKHQDNIANTLRDNDTEIEIIRNGKPTKIKVREYAGGVLGEQGENSALAYAVALQRKQYGESVSEMSELIKHMNPDTGDLQDMLLGKKPSATGKYKDSNGVERTFEFNKSNVYAVEAALENNMAIGTVDMVDQLIEKSGSDLAEYRTTISAALAKAGHTGRSIYQGGRLISEIAQGKIRSHEDLIGYIQGIIADGKFSPTQLAALDAPAAGRFLEAAQATEHFNPSSDPVAEAKFMANFQTGKRRLAHHAETALTSAQIQDVVKDNTAPILQQIRNL